MGDGYDGRFLLAKEGVSVPLRGKEGAGLTPESADNGDFEDRFPSPCGVRRVRDLR